MTAVETTQQLVRIPSVNPDYDAASGAELAMTQWLLAWARKHELKADVEEVLPGRDNVSVTITNGKGPHLLLCGHHDTVAVQEMTIPPFSGEVRDGRLWGRGSADMKGPLAAMLHALLELNASRETWRGTVTVAWVMDEEFLARGVKAFVQKRSDFDFAVIGEPTRLKPIRGCKGALRFSFEAHGRAAHSSTPQLGRNAIVAMSEAILELDQFFATELAAVQRPGFGSSTGSVGLVSGGTGVNIVPESCRASVDIRLLPGQKWEEVFPKIKKAIIERKSRVADVTWKFDENFFTDPPYEVAADHPLVQAACAVTGEKAADVVAFSCDASKIAAAGIPCIILGPGDIGRAHTVDESIGVEEIEAGVRTYIELARRLLPCP